MVCLSVCLCVRVSEFVSLQFKVAYCCHNLPHFHGDYNMTIGIGRMIDHLSGIAITNNMIAKQI